MSVRLIHADCLEALATLEPDSVHAIVTDPPYGLSFMGQHWDHAVPGVEYWRACYRVLKPGGHCLAFAGTRTYHRMACAIEDADFEIRDQLQWLYASGFPKSHDVSKAIDRAAGADREIIGPKHDADRRTSGGKHEGWQRPWQNDPEAVARNQNVTAPSTDAAKQWDGWGTALKPAAESIVFAQKPLAFWDQYATIGSQISTLESCLWSMLPVNIAEKNFGLSPNEFVAACASAQWGADERRNIQDTLSEAMGTARFVLALTLSLSTVLSWKNIWVGGSAPENTSITETELSTTIDLRILSFSLSKITPESIIQAHRTGLWSIVHASTAERVFDATARRLNAILEQRALAPAIAQFADRSPVADGTPNSEFICLARKPLIGTVAENVLAHGTGALNIDGCRIGYANDSDKAAAAAAAAAEQRSRQTDRNFDGWGMDQQELTGETYMAGPAGKGRWPANVCHDGSEEVLAGFPQSDGQQGDVRGTEPSECHNGVYSGPRKREGIEYVSRNDSGSAARFFYCAKATTADRDDGLLDLQLRRHVAFQTGNGASGKPSSISEGRNTGRRNTHPTVKPTALMQWLVRLVTPPGGIVLDPFMGTGSTGRACVLEGFDFIGIEREAPYVELARLRIAAAEKKAPPPTLADLFAEAGEAGEAA